VSAHRVDDPSNADLLALIRWAYGLTERALFLKGHAARQAMAKACSEINHRFKEVAG
jgi:hypothetical protein